MPRYFGPDYVVYDVERLLDDDRIMFNIVVAQLDLIVGP